MDELDERITYGTSAHEADPDEDPAEHIGEVIPDPWDDPDQDDWASGRLDLGDPAAGLSGT
jgi:hypothetical protein